MSREFEVRSNRAAGVEEILRHLVPNTATMEHCSAAVVATGKSRKFLELPHSGDRMEVDTQRIM